jgi:indole-3-glycerol phosphate synthase
MMNLVEIHNEAELDTAIKYGASIIGINNRDLTSFEVDLKTTLKLRPLIPPGCITVSESGIKNRLDMQKLKEWGINAALIGEALMSVPDIAAKMKELL